jgi:hypothetical protein
LKKSKGGGKLKNSITRIISMVTIFTILLASFLQPVGKPARADEAVTAPQPSVTHATTAEDTQTTSGLIIQPNNEAGSAPTNYYKITGITGGQLYKPNGVTRIHNADFITVAEGHAGLKFTPAPDMHGTYGFGFTVQAGPSNNGEKLSAPVDAIVTVTEVNDPPFAADDLLSGILEGSGPIEIQASDLLANDVAGPADEQLWQQLTVTSVDYPSGGTVQLVDSRIIFTPQAHFFGTASFRYTVSDDGRTNGVSDDRLSQATVTFSIYPKADVPSITGTVTAEDTMSMYGLVISRNPVDGGEASHFKITGITGGALYQNDGTTLIDNGQFITVSEGASGLKFRPDYDRNSTAGDLFGFDVQAAIGPSDDAISDKKQAVITVTEVNDAPIAIDDTTETAFGVPFIQIPFAELTANDRQGPPNESGQTLTVTAVSNAVGGSVSIVNGHVQFVINLGFVGTASFEYEIMDNGTTDGAPHPMTDRATVNIDVKDLNKPVITLHGDETVYLLQGQNYIEAGFSAEDDVDGDLTGAVTVSGTVNSMVLGRYTLRYNVKDSSNNTAIEQSRTVHVVSNLLSNLTLGSEVINFQPTQTDYTLDVLNSVEKLFVTPVLLDENSTVTVNGTVVDSGNGKDVSLNVGENVITIVVTALGGTTKTYQVTVNRAPSANADLSNLVVSEGALTPGFAAGTLDYTVDVAHTVNQIALTPIVAEANATVKVNGTAAVSGNEVILPLVVGDNEVTITVTAQDGTTVKTYMVVVTRDLFHPQAPTVTVDDINNLIIGADATMEYSTNDGTTWTSYQAQQVPTFDGNRTVLVRIKAVAGVSTASPVTKLIFTANPIIVTPPAPVETGRMISIVVVDADGKALPAGRVEINRSTKEGQKVDTVELNERKIQTAITTAVQNKKNTIVVQIIDVANDPADKINVGINKEVLALLTQHAMNLVIQTEKATITVPASTWTQVGNVDVTLTIANGLNQKQTSAAIEANAKGAIVVGSSVKVETSFKGHTEMTMPIAKNLLPADSKDWPEFISSLAVFVEHSDGENKVYTGTVQYDEKGTPTGISIRVEKFSTFTVIVKPKTSYTYADDAAISEYAKESVYRLQELGIMEGSQNQFNPQGALTRAQFTKVILNSLGIKVEGSFIQEFKDVKNDHWAFAYIMKAKELGIIKGVDANTFNPNAPITRQQVALMIGRALQLKATTNTITFLDQNKISTEALPYVQALAQQGIIKGNNNHFNPHDLVTREMIATIIARVLEWNGEAGPLSHQQWNLK